MQRSESDSTAHKKEGAFLKSLILHLDSVECDQLCDCLEKAEREGRCIRHALFVMWVLFLLVAGGLGYCALLLPNVFRDLEHLLMRSLFAVGLASVISQLVFLGYMLWHHTVVTRLHERCRLLVLGLARSQLRAPDAPNPNGPVPTQSPGVSRIIYPVNSNETLPAS